MLSLIIPLILASVPLEAVVVSPKGNIIGSGSFISESLVLTANHVVDDFKNYQVGCGFALIPAIVQKTEKSTDLALLKLSEPCPLADVITLSEIDPGRGDSVVSIGCMNGICHTVTNGIIANLIQDPKTQIIKTLSTTKIWMGSSGGPLLNKDNQLVGVCSSMWGMSSIESEGDHIFARTEYLSTFAHLSSIKNFLSTK